MMADMTPPPLGPTVRVLTRTAGLPALLRAVPAYAALAIAASILFSPNGMRAVDLLRVVASSPAVAVALWGGWILLTAPAARVLFESPETFFLRALPVPRGISGSCTPRTSSRSRRRGWPSGCAARASSPRSPPA